MMLFAAVHESGCGTKPTCRGCDGMSGVEGQADAGSTSWDVGF